MDYLVDGAQLDGSYRVCPQDIRESEKNKWIPWLMARSYTERIVIARKISAKAKKINGFLG